VVIDGVGTQSPAKELGAKGSTANGKAHSGSLGMTNGKVGMVMGILANGLSGLQNGAHGHSSGGNQTVTSQLG
jgi:hypothetical protein